MINFSRIAVISLSIFLLSACGAANIKVGRDFDVTDISAKVQQGVTKQEAVRAWLGEPTSVGVSWSTNGERFDEWDYYFAEGKLADMSAVKVKILQIKFDEQAVVRAYNWTASRQ